jgi:DNA-directed RNA polymerase subunit F
MVRPELQSEKPVSMAELKKELEDIKKRDNELNFRGKKTEEYLGMFVELSAKKAEELKEKLHSLKISRLKEDIIIKIIDTLPATIDEMKTLVQGYVVNLSQEDMKKIVDAVNEFAPAKK